MVDLHLRVMADTCIAIGTAVASWQHSDPVDPLSDLTARLRRPVRWMLQHPMRAITRRLRGGVR